MSENLVWGEGVAGPKTGTEMDQIWVEAAAHCCCSGNLNHWDE